MNLTSATKFLYDLYNQEKNGDPQDHPFNPQDHNPQDQPLDPQDLSSDPQDLPTNLQDLNKLKQDIFNNSPNHYKCSQNNINKSSITEPIEFYAYMATRNRPFFSSPNAYNFSSNLMPLW